MTTSKVRATIIRRERLNNTIYGNPRYRVVFETAEGEMVNTLTSSDSGFVYGFNNGGTKDGEPVEITLSRAGRICDVRPALVSACPNCAMCGEHEDDATLTDRGVNSPRLDGSPHWERLTLCPTCAAELDAAGRLS